MVRDFRARPVGWRGESHRHYLASKGVSTKRYLAIKWRPEVGVPVVDHPESSGYRKNEEVVWMRPRDFLDTAGGEDFGVTDEHKQQIRDYQKKTYGDDMEFDTPFLEVDGDGRVIRHDGRNRSAIAEEDGEFELPVRVHHEVPMNAQEKYEASLARRARHKVWVAEQKAEGKRYNSLKDDRFNELQSKLDDLLIEETGINMRFEVLRANKNPSKEEMISGMDEFARLGLRRQQIVQERLDVEAELRILKNTKE